MQDAAHEPVSPDGDLHLTRCMHNDDDDQFHVDLTILDYFVYKATAHVLTWALRPDPYHSALPSVFVNMTAGTHDGINASIDPRPE